MKQILEVFLWYEFSNYAAEGEGFSDKSKYSMYKNGTDLEYKTNVEKMS